MLHIPSTWFGGKHPIFLDDFPRCNTFHFKQVLFPLFSRCLKPFSTCAFVDFPHDFPPWIFAMKNSPPALWPRQVLSIADDQARLLAWGAGRIAVVPWIQLTMLGWNKCCLTHQKWWLKRQKYGDLTLWALKKDRFHQLFLGWAPRTSRYFHWTEGY